MKELEALLNHMMLEQHTSLDSVGQSQTVSLCERPPGTNPDGVRELRTIGKIVPQISGFEFGYTPSRISSGASFTSLFIRGPMARIDWCGLEVRMDELHDEWNKYVSRER